MRATLLFSECGKLQSVCGKAGFENQRLKYASEGISCRLLVGFHTFLVFLMA